MLSWGNRSSTAHNEPVIIPNIMTLINDEKSFFNIINTTLYINYNMNIIINNL